MNEMRQPARAVRVRDMMKYISWGQRAPGLAAHMMIDRGDIRAYCGTIVAIRRKRSQVIGVRVCKRCYRVTMKYA